MSTPLRALLVEDSEQDAFLLAEALRQRGFEPTIVRVETAAGMRAALLGQDWDIVLCDFLMPQFDAFKALDVLRETGREIPLVVVSGTIGEETAVELLTRGATDYLLKDRLARLGPVVNRVLEQQALRRTQRRTEERLRSQAQMLDFIGQAVIATDPAGKILYANRFATQLYGWSREEILGRNIMEITVGETSRAEAEAIMRQLSSGASWTGEFMVRRHDGVVFPAHVTNAPVLDEQGRVVAIIGVSIDITERKQTEEKLRRSERELRELAESLSREKARLIAAQAVAKVGSWETDLATGTVSWSEQTHRIFETDPAKFSPTHQGFLELVHPEDRVRVNEAFERSLNLPTTCRIEHRIITPSGQVKIVEEAWRAFQDAAGRATHAVGTCRDITEQRWVESELRRSEERLELMVNSVRDYAIFQLDPGGRVVSWNTGAEQLTGYSAEEILGCHFSRFYIAQEEAAGLPAAALTAALQDGLTRQEGWRVRKNGSYMWADVVMSPLFGPDGAQQGFTTVVRDMTEPRQMQERLQESERRLQSFLHFSPTVIFIKDTAGRYLQVNQAFVERFGLARDKVLGRTDVEIFPEKQASAFMANDRAVLHGGEAREFEEIAEYVDGTHYSLVEKFPLRNTNGEIYALGGIATDITPLRRVSERMRDQARFITDVLDSLTANVAVLDEQGRILAVNAAWREFASRNGCTSPNAHAGDNYLAVCRQAAERGDTTARAVAEGIRQVLSGRRSRFALEYPCHGPREERWFTINVSALTGSVAGAAVAHEDTTQRRRVADAVRVVAETVASQADNAFFNTLLEQLTRVTGADHAFIGELLPRVRHVRVLASRSASPLQPGDEYDLAGSPCAEVIRKNSCYYERGVAGLFPQDRFLAEWKIEGYTGTTILDSHGRTLGLIVLLSARPLGEPELAASLLRIVATRVSGEFERVAVEGKIRDMAGRLLRSQDYERRVLGRELHDTTAQGLAALEINLAAVVKQARLLPADAQARLRDAVELAGQCAQEIRGLAFSLRPPLLDELGLVPALRVLVAGFARRSGIRCRFTGPRRPPALGREEELALYRVAQEALANVQRHSRSSTADVRCSQTRKEMKLVIADCGRGLPSPGPAKQGGRRAPAGLGLAGMTERMSQLGGKLEMQSSRNGTRITATLPCPCRRE